MAVELTLGKYHYWDDYEDDNIKRFHFFENKKTGEDVHIDFSPYYTVTEHDADAVRKFVEITGRIPDRYDNNGNNFHKGDVYNLVNGLCCCGDPDCNEQYVHWTSGW